MDVDSLKYKFKTSSVLVKIILINAAIFIGFSLFSFLFQVDTSGLLQWFSVSSSFSKNLMKPWSLITYSFLHGGLRHILWNMLFLYWFGRIMLNLFNSKRFLTVYFLGAIAGALLFLVAYNVFPVFRSNVALTSLIGASAAVRAIMIFISTYSPYTEVRFFFFNIKLWHIAVAVLVMDLVQIPISNAGGNIAHLGGALLGYIYASQLKQGRDIGAWWDKLMDSFAGLFKKKKKHPFKKVYKNKSTKQQNPVITDEAKLNEILEKISKSGYESLTKEEKDFLFKSSNS